MRPEILFPLFAPITSVKGVGPKVAPAVERVAGPVVRDLILTAPQGLVVREPATMQSAREGAVQTFDVVIDQHMKPGRAGLPYKIRAHDDTGFMLLVYFKVFGDSLQKHHPAGARRIVSGKVERFRDEVQITHPDYIVAPEQADEIPRLEPVYPTSAGVSSRQLRRFIQIALERTPELPEWQDPALHEREAWPPWRAALELLHAPRDDADLSPLTPVRRRLAYDELFAHQLALCRRKSERRAAAAPVVTAQASTDAILKALPFKLTGAQDRAVAEIRADLGSGWAMARLLQGDVGSGKTVVAVLAMAGAASSGFQAALMAPTEILARQHFERIEPWLAAGGVSAVLLTGRDKGVPRREKLEALASGAAQVAVGTHALFQADVGFKSLAFVVVDEQHRFGVAERKRLQDKGATGESLGVHLLSMSATPIPRTLELTQYGDLDVSRLDEKPPGRKPIATRAVPTARIGEIAARLDAALKQGAQAYWICPLVAESELSDLAAAEARAEDLKKLLKAPVGLVHGQMPGAEKDATMSAFAEGRLSALVATTVVEVGVDVPNATIMVIEHAERFGLAQLHQLRGRVGRGADESACILLYDAPLSETARQRLDVLRETDDGFLIAERDWALRGGGDLLGLKQSGLPDYRLADPIVHRDLLLAAAQDARLILSRDPKLESARGRAVALLTELFDWRPDRLNAPAA
ncbi:MAG TPA: ATP-dependent DNA helicase RecG [Caulobacteraceae bacterium]|jgi:ATP-dependent DNA helicase RecG